MKTKNCILAIILIALYAASAKTADKVNALFFEGTPFTTLEVEGKLDVEYVQVRGATGMTCEVISGASPNLEIRPDGKQTVRLSNIDRPGRNASRVYVRVTYGALQNIGVSLGADLSADKVRSARIALACSTDAHINIAGCSSPDVRLTADTGASIDIADVAAETLSAKASTGATATVPRLSCDYADLSCTTDGSITAAGECSKARLTASTGATINIRGLQCPDLSSNFTTGATLIR